MTDQVTMSWNTRIKLSVMMFLQYMMFSVWFIPLATYLRAEEWQAWLPYVMSTQAFGCIASPLIGMFADRHFASERVLAVLNVLVGVLLIAAAMATSGLALFVCLLLAMLCYMPSWGLTSAIAMAHSPSENFPKIRVFGTIGWVAAGLFSLLALAIWDLEIDGTATVFYCGAVVAFVAAMCNPFLPHTPPPAKGQKASIVDVLGLRAFSLFKYKDFAVFVSIMVLAMIAFSIYWVYLSLFLQDKEIRLLTVTVNWGQFAEMFFMLLIPLSIAWVGLKWTMVIGLAAQLVRYGSFLLGEILDVHAFFFVAIIIHGVIFGFFFIGSQIYVDRRAPKEMRAQAQGLLFLITFGVGAIIGNFLWDAVITAYTVEGVIQWQPVWMWLTLSSALPLVLLFTVFHSNVTMKGWAAEPEVSQEVEQAIEATTGPEPAEVAEEAAEAEPSDDAEPPSES